MAGASPDINKKEGILPSGTLWMLSNKKSSSSLALDMQTKGNAEQRTEQSHTSPQIPLNFDSLQSLTQELGSFMVGHDGFQAGPAPVRVAEVYTEQPSVTVATMTTIEPATATIISASSASSFLPPLPASRPLGLDAEPSVGAFATMDAQQTPKAVVHKDNTSITTVSPPTSQGANAPASSQAPLESNNNNNISINSVANTNNGHNDAATSDICSSLATISISPSSSNHSQYQQSQQAPSSTTGKGDISEKELPPLPPSSQPHSSQHSDLQHYQLQDIVLSPPLAQQVSSVNIDYNSRASSSPSSLPYSSPDPSLSSPGTLSPPTEPVSPSTPAQQQQQLKPAPSQAHPTMATFEGHQYPTYYVTPQGPAADGPLPAPPQQLPYQPPPPPTGMVQQYQYQQQQQQPYQPPPPSSTPQQLPYQPPPPPTSASGQQPQPQQQQQQQQQQPVVHIQNQPNALPQVASPTTVASPSETHHSHMPRRSESSTQMYQQYAQPPPPPLAPVPVPTEDWGALLDRPDSPTHAPSPYGQFTAPYPNAFATNMMTASPAEETTISPDYMQHRRQPSRSTPSPQPLNPYQSGQPLYGAQQPPPPGGQRSLPSYMTHQHHASMSSVPMGAPLSVGGSAAQGQGGNAGDNRQAFRKSWSFGTVMNGTVPPASDRQSIMSAGPGARPAGYNTPPRLGSGMHSKQGSVATSVSLLTDAAIVAKYRETAIKTNDPSIQLSYAKYLLDISADAKDNMESSPSPTADGQGSLPTPSPSSSSSTHSGDGASTPGRKRSSEDQETSGKRQLLQEAVYWIDRLAKEGQPEAQFIRGVWYEEGLYGSKRNPDKALRWFQSSSKGDYAPAHYKVGYYCEKRKDYNKAVMLYKKAAVQNDVPANHRLAMVYLYGELNQDQNMKTGLQYLNRAASNATENAPMAPYILGLILSREYKQLSIPDDIAFPDDGEALEWFKKSAELGYGPANYKLGYCYEIGALRCPIDPFLSVKYYERAVLAGDSTGEAEMALSGWYLSGADNYFPANESLAFQYAQRAADKGLAKAQYALGYYYEVGISVPADINKAMEYYKLAAAQGNKDAQKRLSDRATFDKLGHKNSVRRLKQNRRDKDKECIIM
ncbi:hypothetical protein BGW41_008026 [Actinomortierella wolfii]|nr:hypothetical protein BGW41_008026 [Actinomortierella wolfii]